MGECSGTSPVVPASANVPGGARPVACPGPKMQEPGTEPIRLCHREGELGTGTRSGSRTGSGSGTSIGVGTGSSTGTMRIFLSVGRSPSVDHSSEGMSERVGHVGSRIDPGARGGEPAHVPISTDRVRVGVEAQSLHRATRHGLLPEPDQAGVRVATGRQGDRGRRDRCRRSPRSAVPVVGSSRRGAARHHRTTDGPTVTHPPVGGALTDTAGGAWPSTEHMHPPPETIPPTIVSANPDHPQDDHGREHEPDRGEDDGSRSTSRSAPTGCTPGVEVSPNRARRGIVGSRQEFDPIGV